MAEERLTIVDLRRLIADQANVDEAVVGQFLSALFPAIIDGLRTDKSVRIYGLGSFKLQWVEPRKSVNVSTGEPIVIEGYQKLCFTPEQSLKERVNEPYANLVPVELDAAGKALPQQKRAPIDPLQKMEEQAEEIKDLLQELNGTNSVEPLKEEEYKEQPAEGVDETVVEEQPAEGVVESTVEEQNAEGIAETAETQEGKHQEGKDKEEDVNKKREKQHSRAYRPWLVALITILLFIGALAGGYFYLQYKVEQYADELNKKLENKDEAPMVFGVEPLDEAMEEEDAVIDELDSLLKDENDIIEAVKKVAAEKEIEANIEPNKASKEEKSETVQVVNIGDAKKRKKSDGNGQTTNSPSTNQTKSPTLKIEKTKIKEFQKKREFTEFLGIETVVAGSRLTWIAKKYYGEKDLWVYIYEANRDVLKNPESVQPGMHLRIPKLSKEMMNMHDETNRAYVKQLQDEYLGK
ncbi:MAG: HU family DNA-binding protein [Paludibacteraceae bacterium]|nr:HU family DNA-binding protein [Paludibacteraceae bacterium]